MKLLSWLLPPRPESFEEYEARRVREAEERWRVRNEEKRAEGCPCGQPATEVRYDHRNVGSVPVETWSCAEHVGVTSWAGAGGAMKPYWERSRPCGSCEPSRCGGYGGPIGGPTTRWHCPDRA